MPEDILPLVRNAVGRGRFHGKKYNSLTLIFCNYDAQSVQEVTDTSYLR